MAKEWAKPFYKSKHWLKVRKAFIAHRVSIDGGMCQCGCGELGYIVDHIEELTPENINNPDISLSWNNLQYLALKCHNRKTFGKKDDYNYFFDSNGVLQELPPLKQ
jgi:hypothetical protein